MSVWCSCLWNLQNDYLKGFSNYEWGSLQNIVLFSVLLNPLLFLFPHLVLVFGLSLFMFLFLLIFPGHPLCFHILLR